VIGLETDLDLEFDARSAATLRGILFSARPRDAHGGGDRQGGETT
jgi:hypothetical protein